MDTSLLDAGRAYDTIESLDGADKAISVDQEGKIKDKIEISVLEFNGDFRHIHPAVISEKIEEVEEFARVGFSIQHACAETDGRPTGTAYGGPRSPLRLAGPRA